MVLDRRRPDVKHEAVLILHLLLGEPRSHSGGGCLCTRWLRTGRAVVGGITFPGPRRGRLRAQEAIAPSRWAAIGYALEDLDRLRRVAADLAGARLYDRIAHGTLFAASL